MSENQKNRVDPFEEIEFQNEVDKYIPTIESFFSEIVDISKWEEFLTVGSISDVPTFTGVYDPISRPLSKCPCETIYADSDLWNSKEEAILIWIGIIMGNLLRNKVIKTKKIFKYAWRVKPEVSIEMDFETMKRNYRVYSRSLFWSTNGKQQT